MLKTLYRLFAFALIYCLFSTMAVVEAAPHNGTEMYFNQPDNTSVLVKVWGDEYYQRVESVDGYTLMRDKQGWICYAILNEDQSDFISTSVHYTGSIISLVTQKSMRSKSVTLPTQKNLELNRTSLLNRRYAAFLSLNRHAAPAISKAATTNARTGSVDNVTGLTVLIDFSDEPASLDKASIERYFNQAGYSEFGNNGSVHDYYIDVSAGKIVYNNIVMGYYRAKNPKTYYDCNTQYGKTSDLLQEAYTWLAQSGFNFSSLSTDGTYVRAVNFFYAGYPTQGWTYGLWPHQSSYYFRTQSGVEFAKYQLTNIGSELSLATTCHENGHMLMGWPDLYDYGYNGSSYGLGYYCLMAYQGASKNPVPPNAYLRYKAGWDDIENINSFTGTISCVSNASKSYKYDNPVNAQEYFLIESRTGTGRNTSLPDYGLMIWHVDEAGSNEYQQMTYQNHYLVSLEQADGKFDLENNQNLGNYRDLFWDGNKSTFNDYTLPNSNWWSGVRSSLSLSNISAVGDIMTFNVSTPAYSLPAPTNLSALQSGNQVVLNWTDNATDESGFVIERKGPNDNSFVEIATVASTPTSYADLPDQSGGTNTYIYRIYAYNNTGESRYSNEAQNTKSRSPYTGSPLTIPGVVKAECYDNGGEGVAYHDYDSFNSGNFRTTEGVDVENCSNGGYDAAWLVPGEWIEYTVNVTSAGNYTITSATSAMAAGGKFSISIGGQQLSSIDVPATGGWQTWTSTAALTAYLNQGTQVLRFTVESGGFNVNNFTFAAAPMPLANGLYSIQVKSSGKIIDVRNASSDNGTSLLQWDYYGNTNQQWSVTKLPNGYYKIIVQHSGKCIDDLNWSLDNGTALGQWDYYDNANQQWAIDAVGDGYYKVTNSYSGKVMEVAGTTSMDNGALIQQWDYVGGPNQQWKFIPVVNNTASAAPAVRSEHSEHVMPYPNPFTTAVTIPVVMQTAGVAHVEIFNSTGTPINTWTTAYLEAGNQSIEWDGAVSNSSSVESGIYVYKIRVGSNVLHGKVIKANQ